MWQRKGLGAPSRRFWSPHLAWLTGSEKGVAVDMAGYLGQDLNLNICNSCVCMVKNKFQNALVSTGIFGTIPSSVNNARQVGSMLMHHCRR